MKSQAEWKRDCELKDHENFDWGPISHYLGHVL